MRAQQQDESCLTIGVLAYNNEMTLSKCLDSIIDSNPSAFQIIILDNFSNDGTEEVCRRYADQFDCIKYIRQPENSRSDANFRYLLGLAKTKYFMWLAAADWLSPRFISSAVDFLESNPDYTLVTGSSAYFHEETGVFQYRTCPSSIEASRAGDRVISFIENHSDNLDFYGVFRRSSLIADEYPLIDVGWLWLMKIAYAGKIRSLSCGSINRYNILYRRERHEQTASNDELSQSQALHPHYAIALYCFFHFVFDDGQQKEVEVSERIRLGWRIFQGIRSSNSLPAELDIWRDSIIMFGNDYSTKQLCSLRATLHDQCRRYRDGLSDALTPDEVLEISLTFRLWRQYNVHKELVYIEVLGQLTANDAIGFIENSLYIPAHLQRYVPPRLTEFLANVQHLIVEYITEPMQIFETDEEICDYYNNLLRFLLLFEDEILLGQEVIELRVSKIKLALLTLIVTKTSYISSYFYQGDVRPLMEARGRLTRALLMINGINTDNWLPKPNQGLRKKIGLLAQSLNSPTDTYTTLPAIAHLDRSKFEVIIIILSKASAQVGILTPMESYAAGLVDKVILMENGTIAEKIESVRTFDFDIILIGNNITAVSSPLYLMSVARLARRQIVFNPCCVTSGLSNVDFFVSGSYAEDRDSQFQYTEKLLMIDGPAHVRLIPPFENNDFRSPRARQGNDVRFISGANIYKLTPATRRAWLNILSKVPESTLYLYPFGPAWSSNYESEKILRLIHTEAEGLGVEINRIVMCGPFSDTKQIRDLLVEMDIYLDSFPFSGINSILDPLSASIPVIARCGNSFRSNMGASVLRELKLEELLAESESDFVELAVRLAADATWRGKISQLIFERLKLSRLYDAVWYSTQFSKIFDECLT